MNEGKIMTIKYQNKLSTRLFSPLIIIFILMFIILSFYVPKITKENAVNTAIQSAESTVNQYKTIRGYYTKNVIKKILPIADVSPDYIHKNDPNKIPLPATFIHEISEEFTKKGIMTLKLYSPFPFPNRDSRKLDNFGKKA